MSTKNLIGIKFGDFTIVKLVGKDKWNSQLWEAECKCGTKKIATGTTFKNLKKKMCTTCAKKKEKKIRPKPPFILYPKPKRLYKDLIDSEVEKHRKFDCVFYSNCLDHGAVFYWISFSCEGCVHYFKDHLNLENTEEDRKRCQRLTFIVEE